MRTIIPFNDNWTFLKPGEDRVPVTLPHTWNNLDGQDGGGDYWRGECVYEKAFAAPDRKADEEIYLEFDGVSASAKVTLNDHFIGEHHGATAGSGSICLGFMLAGKTPPGTLLLFSRPIGVAVDYPPCVCLVVLIDTHPAVPPLPLLFPWCAEEDNSG